MSPQSTFMLVVQLLMIYHQGVFARQNYYMPRQEIQQMMLDDLDNSQEPYYNDLKKVAQNDPNFLSNWPYLRELLPPNYDTSTNRIFNNLEDRIQIDEILPSPLPLQKNIPNLRNSIKDQAQKKNSNSQKQSAFKKQYMHACHFKICNMGRKRNARFDFY